MFLFPSHSLFVRDGTAAAAAAAAAGSTMKRRKICFQDFSFPAINLMLFIFTNRECRVSERERERQRESEWKRERMEGLFASGRQQRFFMRTSYTLSAINSQLSFIKVDVLYECNFTGFWVLNRPWEPSKRAAVDAYAAAQSSTRWSISNEGASLRFADTIAQVQLFIFHRIADAARQRNGSFMSPHSLFHLPSTHFSFFFSFAGRRRLEVCFDGAGSVLFVGVFPVLCRGYFGYHHGIALIVRHTKASWSAAERNTIAEK